MQFSAGSSDRRDSGRDIESPALQLNRFESPCISGQTQISRVINDPVWGDLEFVGRGPSRWQALCFGVCPCLMIGLGGGRRCCAKNQANVSQLKAMHAWRKFLLSFSTFISALQVAMFIAVMAQAPDAMPVSADSMWGPHPYFLDRWGAKNTARIVYQGEWWRLLSACFLHSGLGHILANLLVQVRLGISLEQMWGRWRWLSIYILSGIYSSLASCVLLPDTLSVGGSGAICGLLGAEIVFLMFSWKRTEAKDVVERNIQICSFVIAVLVTAGLSFLPMVDFAAHAGGFVVGVLLASLLFANHIEKPAFAERMRSGACALLVILFVLTLAFLVWRVEPSKSLLDICRPEKC